MELKSLTYIIFASISILIYFSLYKKDGIQKYVLLFVNTIYIFSLSGKKSLTIIIVLSLFCYVLGESIEKQLIKKQKGKACFILWSGIFTIIGVLCYFKFFIGSYTILQTFAVQYNIRLSDLASPIGISYYSLTMVAYLFDIYHKKIPAEKNYLDFYTVITYFPSIVQGPVNLYKKVSPQIKSTHKPNADRIIKGLQRSLWGYFKKIVIADRIGIFVIGILQNEESAGFLIFIAMFFYSFQIYTDFSGGIDVIMGISEILDIKLTENFKSPLISKNITEYWQRWHMSLGEFMEKYIYYPLVLNRNMMKFSKKIPNKYLQKVFSATIASIVVFVTVGIWHGTGWNYVAYGCYQALFVSTAVLLGPIYKKLKSLFQINDQCISWHIFTIIRTFGILVFGRYFIRARDLHQAMELFSKTFKEWNIHILFDGSLLNYGLDYKNFYLMLFCVALIICVDILHEKNIHFRNIIMKQDICFRFFIYFLAIFGIIIFGIYGPEFSSSSFIYQEF